MQSQLDSAAVYTDFSGLAALRGKAQNNSPEALEEVARQFEALFVQMMLKSMRDATPESGLFDSNQMEFYQEQYDKQLSIHLAQERGIGLAETLVRQMRAQGVASLTPEQRARENFDLPPRPTRADTPPAESPESDWLPGSPAEFVRDLWPHAEKAASKLGVASEVLIAQAALETGWGQKVIHRADGRSSFNLFGIKAGAGWTDDKATVSTLEYVDGIPERRQAAFRAYDSVADSFEDYVAFLQDNPRYREALQNVADGEAFLEALQQAGYATDPAYADKIGAVMRGTEFGHLVVELKSGAAEPIS